MIPESTNCETKCVSTFSGARAIGIDNMLGSIEVGKIANLVVLNENLEIQQTIVNGKMS